MNQGNQATITPRVWPIALKTTSKEMLEYICYKSKMVVPHLVMHSTSTDQYSQCIGNVQSSLLFLLPVYEHSLKKSPTCAVLLG